MVHEEWGFVKSLYFSISTMSTAGLQGVNVNSKVSMVFTGIYVLLGVPLYGVCLGQFSSFMVNRSQEKKITTARRPHRPAVLAMTTNESVLACRP